MKLIIKAAAVLALAVIIAPTVVRLQARWNAAQPRIQAEQQRAEAAVEAVKQGADGAVKAYEELTGRPQ